jgi:hypothetical protein
MKQSVISKIVFNLCLAAIPFALAPAAHGQAPAAHGQSCSLNRVDGAYAILTTGYIIGTGGQPNQPRHSIARLDLTNAGRISGPVTASLNGNVTRTVLNGTFTVNADCTGTTSFSESDLSGNLVFNGTADLIWDDNMNEIRLIFTSATLPNGTPVPNVISGTARRLVPKD